MTLRGNYKLAFLLESISGVLILLFTYLYGDFGLAAVILFIIGTALTAKNDADEREMQLVVKAGNYSAMIVAFVLTFIYVKDIDFNWFYAFASAGLISRGIIGTVLFMVR